MNGALNSGGFGGAEGNRTPDLCSAIAALSHLSYGPGSGRHLGGAPGILSRKAEAGGKSPPAPLRGLARTALRGYTSAGPAHLEHIRDQLIAYILDFLSYLITLYIYVIIAGVILSWLMAFGVVNPYNPTVRAIWQALNALTEPLLRPIRNVLPNLGAIDISPIILLLGCFFVQGLIELRADPGARRLSAAVDSRATLAHGRRVRHRARAPDAEILDRRRRRRGADGRGRGVQRQGARRSRRG